MSAKRVVKVLNEKTDKATVQERTIGKHISLMKNT